MSRSPRPHTATVLLVMLTLQAWLLVGCGERSRVDPDAEVTV